MDLLAAWWHQLWPISPASAVWPNLVASTISTSAGLAVHHLLTRKRQRRIAGALEDKVHALHLRLDELLGDPGALAQPDEES